MTILDRLVGWWNPSAGLRRHVARRHLDGLARSYDGAKANRRVGKWNAPAGSANSSIAQHGRLVRLRARDLVRNTPHAARIVDVLTSQAVGTGIIPVPDTGSDRKDRLLADLWEEWAEVADAAGWSWSAWQECLVRTMIVDGEALGRAVMFKRAERPVLPLRLVVLDPDLFDERHDWSLTGKDERLGVEHDAFGAPTGFWLYDRHPAEQGFEIAGKRYDARYVSHAFRRLRPGQIRGVSWLAPLILTARDLADFLEATMVKARTEALFAAFVTTPEDENKAPAFGDTDLTEENDKRVRSMGPSRVEYLKPGEDVKFAQPTSSGSFDPIMLHTLMAMAAGAGVTYDQITGDLRQANYSSLRAGKIEFRRLIEQLQWNVLIPRPLGAAWRGFTEAVSLSGRIRLPVQEARCKWVTPAWEPIDPKKDLEADIAAVQAGRMAPQEFIAMWGRDWRKVVEDWASFKRKCDELGLDLTIFAKKPGAKAEASAAGDEEGAKDAEGGDEKPDDKADEDADGKDPT